MEVRAATADDLLAVRTVLDSALLQVDRVRRAITEDELLVAVSAAQTVLGALVLDGVEITAIAVRRRRRDQGIGTALVAAAARRRERLRAEFDGRVAAFWRSVGFDIEPLADSDRFCGYRETTETDDGC